MTVAPPLTPVTFPDPSTVATAEFAEDQESIVVIRADEGTRHGRVVEVMDLAKQVGFAKLAIAIRASSGEVE